MCPAHAALRHISRLRAAGLWLRGGPLFPDAAGGTWAKGDAVLLFRRVLLAAGVALTTVDHEGHVVQLFAGHAARVAGAAWLASRGVPTPIIQLLGRWSSTPVERYVQAAPLALAPEIPGRVLAGGGTRAAHPVEARRATSGGVAPDAPAVWASTRRRARTLSSTKRARRCTAPTRRRIAPSSSFGDPGAGPGPMASGGFSGSRRSRRPRLGAHGASR